MRSTLGQEHEVAGVQAVIPGAALGAEQAPARADHLIRGPGHRWMRHPEGRERTPTNEHDVASPHAIRRFHTSHALRLTVQAR
jgi:hypothetical protein